MIFVKRRRKTNLKSLLRKTETAAILSALRDNAGNMKETADQLGVSRSTLYRRVEALRMKTTVKRVKRRRSRR